MQFEHTTWLCNTMVHSVCQLCELEKDCCQRIAIWHESNPPSEAKMLKKQIKGLHFCFANMEAFVDREWKKGVAVCLQRRTVATWDS